MTFRDKLADWISGGKFALTNRCLRVTGLNSIKYEKALQEIVNRDTPKASPAAKRAANIARKALEK